MTDEYAERAAPFEAPGGIAGEAAGRGLPVVLLHGLTATRRYVVHGSRLLLRRGCRVLSYDARGHGRSSPAPSRHEYGYEHLVADLVAVLEHNGLERVVLAGHSMGAATALAFALGAPGRVAALVQIGPAYTGRPHEEEHVQELDTLADALERGGVDGFLRAYEPSVPAEWRDAVLRFTRQRLARHLHPAAVADALRVVPRSEAFAGLDLLERVSAPTLVVGSRDEADPAHPLSVAQEYAARLPHAELIVEEPGRPPIAWRGAELSRAIADFLERLL